jgi:hypothetical protein
MGFTSVDDLVSELSNEKVKRSDWQYVTETAVSTVSLAVGVDLSSVPGQFGTKNQYPGTARNWVSCSDAAGNGTQIFGIPHGGNVSPETKHLLHASAILPPAGLPVVGGVLVLVDLQGYWPGINHGVTTTQTLLGTPTLRYESGSGCRLYLVTTAQPASGTYNINVSYVNQSGNTSTIPATAGRSFPVISQIASAAPGLVPSLYLPLVDGDTGITNVNDIQFTTARAGGTAALCLAKPLCTIPLTTAVNHTTEREFVYQTPSVPRIYDGACLTWLYFSGVGGTGTSIGANTTFVGHIETAWS